MALNGKSVLVTGASRGIGQAIALAAAQAGASVALTARSQAPLEALAGELTTAGGKALALPADAGDGGAIQGVVDQTVAAFGGIDALINNAGMIEPIARIEAADAEAWNRAFAVNATGPAIFAKAALPHLRAAKGTVVNISSGAAHIPLEGWAAYCATKAALYMFTLALHLEEGQSVDVYGVSPGTIDTEMQGVIRASGVNPVSQIPRENLGSPQIPADAVVWLLENRPEDLKGTDIRIREAAFLERAGI